MSDNSIKKHESNSNPFRTSKADELWKRLDENGKKITKEELLRRAKELKDKSAK